VFIGGIFPSVLKDSSVFILRGKDTSLLGLLDPEDEGIIMLWNVPSYSFNSAVSHPRRLNHYSSFV